MSRLEELIEQYCPDGVECVPLSSIGTIKRGNGLQKKDFVKTGIGCIHYGQIYTKFGLFTQKTLTYVDKELADHLLHIEKGDLVIACTSENVEDVCKAVAWLGDDSIVTGGHSCVLHHNQNPKYIAYFFQTESFQRQKRKYAYGTKVIDIKPDSIGKIEIPVPPLPVQEEIVRILDNFTELQAELQAELQKRKQQYNFYRDNLLNFKNINRGGQTEVKWMKLKDIGKVCMCKRILKSQTSSSGDVPFFKIGTFGGNADAYISQALFNEYKAKYSYPQKGDVLISAAGTIGRTIVFDGTPSYFQDSNIVWLKHDESIVLNSYLRYCYALNPWVVSTGGTIARLYNDNILEATIPVPSLANQQRIVSILDRFDRLANDLTAGLPAELEKRRQQYEYYRDKLLTFKRKEA